MHDFIFDEAWVSLFKKVYSKLQKYMDSIYQPYGLTSVQVEVLLLLAANGDQTVTELSEGLGVTKSNLSTLCKRMEKSGFVKRKRSKQDERVVVISMTDLARSSIQEFLEQKDQATSNMSLSEEDKKVILDGLHRLESYLA